MSKITEQVSVALQRSVPLVAVRTADIGATLAEVASIATVKQTGIVQWDAAGGISPVTGNDVGATVLKQLGIKPGAQTASFVEAMVLLDRMPPGMVVFAHNVHRQLLSQEPAASAASVQAVANLRDRYKLDHRMLVMAGKLFAAPPELEQDVVVLDSPLPTAEDLGTIVDEILASARLPKAKGELRARAVDALSGLSAFAAEQVVAMSLTREGLDLDAMWERKRQQIEQTPGLSVWRGQERFSDIVGLGNIKGHLSRRKASRTPVGVVVFLDEIDKAMPNHVNDSNGTKLDQLRGLLTEMENNEWRGCVLVGAPGAGKSMLGKAFGNEIGVPTISLDLAGLESKYVGESEANLRSALAIIRAIGGGRAYFIATSNDASVMRPELQRRFTDGMWMFDLPTEAEQAAAWAHYRRKYEIKASDPSPKDTAGWTPAEVRNACRYAWDTGCTLQEAAQFIVPMSQSRGMDVEALRVYAHGKFLDASKPGVYQYDPKAMAPQMRAISLPGKETVQ